MTKDVKIDGEITCFEWDEALQEWMASFTQSEIKGFIRRAKERIRKQTLEEVLELFAIAEKIKGAKTSEKEIKEQIEKMMKCV